MLISQSTKKSPFSDICRQYITVRLTCNDGFSVTLCSIGASIRQILFPASDGDLKNIALAFDEDTDYFSNSLYAGATLAPCAGRISHGRLSINDSVYSLSLNENNTHTLHGGSHNASFKNWELVSAEIDTKDNFDNRLISSDKYSTHTNATDSFSIETTTDICSAQHNHTLVESATVVFRIILEDGLDGFPGKREIKAIYTLKEDHTLTLRYEAISDKDTYFNISNHTYFNLSGDYSSSALTHKLQIQADKYICNTPDFIPESISSVKNTPFDFRRSISLLEQMQTYPNDIQLKRNQGFNHEFILNHDSPNHDKNERIAMPLPSPNTPDLICTSPDNSIQLRITSDSPCVVLYSGGYLENGIKLKDKQLTSPGCALAFEFQDYLDAPGNFDFPYHITKAGELWNRQICYRFLNPSGM